MGRGAEISGSTTGDEPPLNGTKRSWNFPLMIPWSGQGAFREGREVDRGADRACAALRIDRSRYGAQGEAR